MKDLLAQSARERFVGRTKELLALLNWSTTGHVLSFFMVLLASENLRSCRLLSEPAPRARPSNLIAGL